jgi:putative transposase
LKHLHLEVLRRPVESAQYTSAEFGQLLVANDIVQSFSRPRQCWDNAVAESWFASLKEECIHRRSWATRAQARHAVFDYIEIFYNRQRLHSSLGYLTPVEYEAIHQSKAAQAA